jgi:hypothetical protein
MMLVLLLLALASPWVTALDNGLAHTPQVRPAAATPPPHACRARTASAAVNTSSLDVATHLKP